MHSSTLPSGTYCEKGAFLAIVEIVVLKKSCHNLIHSYSFQFCAFFSFGLAGGDDLFGH